MNWVQRIKVIGRIGADAVQDCMYVVVSVKEWGQLPYGNGFSFSWFLDFDAWRFVGVERTKEERQFI